MKWAIPAKTFLLGEYAALAGGPAIVLTTSPCFELTLSDTPGLQGIHPASPAGQYWARGSHVSKGLHWHDPYQGRGGLGASSAQFLGAYFASMHLQNQAIHQQTLLDAYMQISRLGEGLPPSGYDVLAQSLSGCVYIDRQKAICQTYTWPFKDIAFILLHTGQKLATHHHLQTLDLPIQVDRLAVIVEQAKHAFECMDSQCLIDAVNAYHQQLAQMNLVAEHSLKHIKAFKEETDILAAKGCGAMGADILLLVVPTKKQLKLSKRLSSMGWNIVGTSTDLYADIVCR